MHPEVFETRTARIWLSGDGIIHLVYSAQVEVTLNEMMENIRALTAVSNGQKRPILADIRNMRSADRDVREQSMKLGHIVKCAAIIASSQTTIMLGNLFMNFNKPEFPTRLFRTEEDGIAWLKSFPD